MKCPVCKSRKSTTILQTKLWNAEVSVLLCDNCGNLYAVKRLKPIAKSGIKEELEDIQKKIDDFKNE